MKTLCAFCCDVCHYRSILAHQDMALSYFLVLECVGTSDKQQISHLLFGLAHSSYCTSTVCIFGVFNVCYSQSYQKLATELKF